VIAWREWACGEVENEHSEHRRVEAEWDFEVGGEELGEPTHLPCLTFLFQQNHASKDTTRWCKVSNSLPPCQLWDRQNAAHVFLSTTVSCPARPHILIYLLTAQGR